MIIVTETYQGRATGEQPIRPGQYAEDAEGLFGLADFLVERGSAYRVEGVSPSPLAGGQVGDIEQDQEAPSAGDEAEPKKRSRGKAAEAELADEQGQDAARQSVRLDETGRPAVDPDAAA